MIGFSANFPQSRFTALWRSADLFNRAEKITEAPNEIYHRIFTLVQAS